MKEVIEGVWPDGVVEMPGGLEGSWFWDVHPKLTRVFSRIRGTRPLRQRQAEGGPVWWDGSDPDADPPDECEHSRSYHLFFISPLGDAFEFDTEAIGLAEPQFLEEEFQEAGWGVLAETTTAGRGCTGWSVAVSLLAPLAVITPGETETFEDGSTTEPQIETYAETPEGKPITNVEEHFRKCNSDRAFEVLLKLRGKIVDTLGRHGISVLPEEEWRKPVPWLRGSEEALVGTGGEPIRVLDAFFFECL